jgi:hypothetical protein
MMETAMSEWQPIETAPKDGRHILVFVDCAETPIVRLAFWSDGELWEMQGYDSLEEVRGWWSYENSVTQEKLDGPVEPTHWMPAPEFPKAGAR